MRLRFPLLLAASLLGTGLVCARDDTDPAGREELVSDNPPRPMAPRALPPPSTKTATLTAARQVDQNAARPAVPGRPANPSLAAGQPGPAVPASAKKSAARPPLAMPARPATPARPPVGALPASPIVRPAAPARPAGLSAPPRPAAPARPKIAVPARPAGPPQMNPAVPARPPRPAVPAAVSR